MQLEKTILTQKLLHLNGNSLLILFGLYVTIMTMGIMEFSYGLIPMGLVAALLIIISAAGLGIVLNVIEKRTKTKISRWFFFTGTLTFISVVAFLVIGNIQGILTDYRAEKIIQGLEQYHAGNGKYPDSLEMLTTEYLSSVPSTAYGVISREFDYIYYSPNKYGLLYYSYIGVEHKYNSEVKEWQVED